MVVESTDLLEFDDSPVVGGLSASSINTVLGTKSS
jgi:hypothetical protein